MENSATIALILVILALANGAPPPQTRERDRAHQRMAELRDLINKARDMTTDKEDQYNKANIKIIKAHLSTDDMRQDACKNAFPKGLMEESIISGMKIFQDLVRVTQDLQMSESGIHYGDEAPFVTEFRQLEYHMRDLVEDSMRKEAFAIIDQQDQTKIPKYSVGGYTPYKETDRNRMVIRNLKNLSKIRQCLHKFVQDVIDPAIGN